MEAKETSSRESLDSAGAHSALSQLIVVIPNQGEPNDQTEENGAVFTNSMLEESGKSRLVWAWLIRQTGGPGYLACLRRILLATD